MGISRCSSILHYLSLVLMVVMFGCAPSRQDQIVATVGNNKIMLGEFENLFVKTNGSPESAAQSTQEEREKFLGLVTNFRLKLMDAYSNDLDKSPEIISEVNLYKGSLTSSFLTEREVTRPGIRKLYEDRKTEYRAIHILLSYLQSATSHDSIAAYAKAYDLIAKLKAGEDFGTLAAEHSQDPGGKQNKGDLYYFTSGQMVGPFEEAAKNMQPGELLGHPVRTQFGLHIIKLVDKRPAPGEIRCSHIMARFSSPDPTPEDTALAFAKIAAVRDSLAAGTDFAELAKRNSADPGSAPNGGDLGWFSRRRWVFEFDEAAFKLKPGERSGIVRSRYGYHLIKCTDSRAPKTFEESEKELQQLYQQTRFQDDYRKLVNRLKVETQFSMDQTIFSRFSNSLDTLKTLKDARWTDSLSADLRKSTLFRLGQNVATVDSVVTILKQRSDLANTSLKPAAFRGSIDKVAEQLIFATKSASTEREYPEFGRLMNEYTEGILLYQVEQENVWGKIAVNDSSMRAFFNTNRGRFTFPDRVDFEEIRSVNDSVARAFLAQARAGNSFSEIAAIDSARMKRKNNFTGTVTKGSTKIPADLLASLQTVADEMIADVQLRVHLISHPDTVGGKSRDASLAEKRLQHVEAYLTGKGVPANRIQAYTRPVQKNVTSTDERARQNLKIDIDLIGRRASMVGKVERLLTPVGTDDRSVRADSLEIGQISSPFRYKNGISLVRLFGRDKAREKTFEEAGTELSSTFQEYESKRLEREWLDRLRAVYPVTEHNEVLKSAFAPAN